MAILSNKPHQFTQKTVNRFLANWQFASVSGSLPDVPIKPDPSGALTIARQLKIPVQKFLYLGDSNTDMQTALAAGMQPIAALWGFRSEKELHDAGAKIMLKHPLDLLNCIN
jgi:phosphoglycolate phosphatase